jgi:signal transduction histidine kinase
MRKNGGIRVLIVEDDASTREDVRGMVEKLGYIVAGSACSGEEAVASVGSMRPDVVIMDYRLPGMDGIDATRHICRSYPVPVVLLTVFSGDDIIERAGKEGIGAYLIKPPDLEDLRRAIAIAVARFADLMQLREMNAQLKCSLEEREAAQAHILSLNEKLERKAAELERLNRELEAFGFMVSHDLKSPLSLISGYARMLEDEPGEGRLHALKVIQKYIAHMERLLDDLSTLCRPHPAALKVRRIDMGRLARAVFLEVNMKEKTPTRLTVDALPPANGDHVLIHQVFQNLLANAVKFASKVEYPEIDVEGWNEEDRNVYCVRDNGIGFDPDRASRLFVPFSRLHGGEYEGSGIGLAIVRRIIEYHGGTVWAEGKPGEGAAFFFSLPRGCPE